MNRAFRSGLVLLLLTAGCTLADRRGDLEILPGGPLRASRTLSFEIGARSSAPQVIVSIDGRDRGPYDTNERLDLDVSGLAEGVHTIRARLATGGKDSPERTFEIDRTAPTVTLDPPPGVVAAPDPLVVTLSFSKPIDVAALQTSLTLPVGGVALPTTVNVAADGLSATVRLDVPLRFVSAAQLELATADLFGNAAVPFSRPIAWSAPPTPFDVPSGLVANQSAAIPVSLDPAWTGATGPLTVLLCASNPSLSGPSGCLEVPLASAPGVVTFDTSAMRDGSYVVLVRSPTLQQSPARQLTVHHPALWVDLIPEKSLVNGPVRIAVQLVGDLPDSLDLLANGTAIGTLAPPPGVGQLKTTFTWSAAVPDGTYAFGVAAPAGWTVQARQVGSVTIDRTPPTFQLRSAGTLDSSFPVVQIAASEDVTGTAALRLDGTPISTAAPTGTRDFSFVLPTGPSTSDGILTFDLSAVMDAAGNVGALAASVRYPVWLGLFGEGPLLVAGSPIVAKEAVTVRLAGSLSGSAGVGWIDSAGALHWSTFGDTVISTAGAVAAGLSAAAGNDSAWVTAGPTLGWSETAAGGGASVRLWYVAPAGSATAAPGATLPRFGALGEAIATWTEPDGAGGRTVQFLRSYLPAVPPFAPASGLPTDAVTDFATGATYRALAWIDGSGAVPQLALSNAAVSTTGTLGPWLTVAASLNVDPAKPASEPALSGSTLAWVEGGLVRSARIDAAGTGVVHDDPPSAGPCRWPRFLPWHPASDAPVLVFVEGGAAGDVIAARRWISGTGWTSLPAVNAGVAGPVRSLAVAGSVVTWTDDLGHVYARRLNR
ncbi:MAG TPA: hypothetical protein VFP50_12310 [Anaeromyxobacteraceae bacterium]|nr:hypothetical protein [Anaeromyxobacteraceae bacterium]